MFPNRIQNLNYASPQKHVWTTETFPPSWQLSKNIYRRLFLPSLCSHRGCQGWKKNFLTWLQGFNNSTSVNQRKGKHLKIPKEGVRARAGVLPVRKQSPLLLQESSNFFACMVIVRVAKLPGRNWAALGKRWAVPPKLEVLTAKGSHHLKKTEIYENFS